jgi:outer membrane lipoprotein-sorting protein
MKRVVTLGLAAALLITTVGARLPSLSVYTQSAGRLNSVLNRLERNRRELRSLRASISLEKYNSQIGDTDKYQGVVLYLPAKGRNANVRVDWQSPQRESLAVINGQYTLYQPRKNQAYVGNARSSKNKVGGVFELLNLSSAELRARFDVESLGEERLWGGVGADHLKIVPKSASSYKYAETWIDSSGMIVQTKVVERNDDTTTVRLTNIERNVPIQSNEFNIQLDSNVKRVRG